MASLADARDQVGGADQVAHADARADRLRERGRVDHLVGLVHREHRRQRLALEAQLHVGVVLEDGEAVLGRQLEQPAALLERERAAGRVLEVGDDVRERRVRAPLQRQLERLDVDAVRLERDGEQLRAELPQRQQRAVVGGRLDHHHVTGLDQLLEQERVRLHRAVGGEGPVRLDAVLRGDPLEQVRVAGRGAVRERARRVALERALSGGLQVIDGDDVERRGAARERDVGELRHDRPLTITRALGAVTRVRTCPAP